MKSLALDRVDRRLFMAGVAAGGLAIGGGRRADVTIFHGGPIRTMEDALRNLSRFQITLRLQTICIFAFQNHQEVLIQIYILAHVKTLDALGKMHLLS